MLCAAEGCEVESLKSRWCPKHYARMWRLGTLELPSEQCHLKIMGPASLAWVAGIIEGEGTFVAQRRRRGNQPYGKISVQMTDEDIVQRLQIATGVGVLGTLSVRGLMTKPAFWWTVGRRPDVVALCSVLRCHLGIRRTAQMDRMLSAMGSK